jgi:hypothetical protein
VNRGLAPARRAPRLPPSERLAPYITRRGRFRAIDPAVGRPLPPLSHVLGTMAWAGLLFVAFRRSMARRTAG